LEFSSIGSAGGIIEEQLFFISTVSPCLFLFCISRLFLFERMLLGICSGIVPDSDRILLVGVLSDGLNLMGLSFVKVHIRLIKEQLIKYWPH
jgi:hypothetical protein